MLRFPSAPLDGLQRMHLHHNELETSESFHTFRVLRSGYRGRTRRPVKRIFLMHTGLNERVNMGLYYRLASQLIEQEPRTVCVVRPFPGHMTRYPYQAFAETPMDHYLWDGSHLFRQFLRFMVETQWFLSAIVRRSTYRCASGANLLSESDELTQSRLHVPRLAHDMQRAWQQLAVASVNAVAADEPAARGAASRVVPEVPVLAAAIEALRGALDLDDFPPRSGQENDALDEHAEPAEPDLHVLGYSLGGFTAQSVFMSWPFLIASCSSVLAGGALRELAPTGFTDPEEWQTVLHSLRYELDDRMMSSHLHVGDDDTVAGIDPELFTSFKRTFYEVFQQEYRGSIQTRLEAFRERMLFIVGGDDPVVRPETVLQSGPKGGVNLLEIGGLGHFIDNRRGSEGERQPQQQTFWLPEMAALIHRFSDNAADEQRILRPFVWFDRALERPVRTRKAWNAAFGGNSTASPEQVKVRPMSPRELIAIEQDGALPDEVFERCLDDLLARANSGPNGVLFVLRNEIPAVLLPPAAVRETAAALCHDDFDIVRYCHGVAERRSVMESRIDRICVVLPWNAKTIMLRMDRQRAYPSQAEGAGGHVTDRLTPEVVWERSLDECFSLANHKKGRHSVRRYDGREPLPELPESGDQDARARLFALARTLADGENLVPSLPDCWVWVARDLLFPVEGSTVSIEEGIPKLISEVPNLCASPEQVLKAIREDRLRIVDVSRARYNPRFRGRLLVDGRAARRRLIHVTTCLARSKPVLDTATAAGDRTITFS